MTRSLTLLILVGGFVQTAASEERTVTGSVTYMATGNVYTSLGREIGLKDSTIMYVRSNGDTIAVLKVLAVSSKSSVSTILTSKRSVRLGDSIITRVSIDIPKPKIASSATESSLLTPAPQASDIRAKAVPAEPGPIEIRGRVSVQYYTNRYDNALYNTTQPGVVLNMRARSTDIPLKLEVYSNIRSLAYGKASPFSKGAVNQSRIYRLSLQYDDGENDVSIGRIIPTIAPAVGYIDGAMYARRIGRIILGTTFGYQPSYSLQGISTDFRKVALFASVQPVDSMNFTISSAYARTYNHALLDREVLSGNLSFYTTDGFQVYGYSEFDLRTPLNGQFKLSPALTSCFVNASYRVSHMLTLGIGGDASRPLYPFSTARLIPDSVRETRLRTGINAAVSLYFPGGVSLSNTYAPRTSQARFATVFSNYTSLGVSDVFSSGVSFRANFTLNTNEYSKSNGYGVSAQKNLSDIADINLRYQQNAYTLKNYGDKHVSRTFGSDLIMSLTRQFSAMLSYDRLDGYGIKSNSVFVDLSMRF